MNSKDYFVMLTTQSGEYAPLMDGNDIAKFTTAYGGYHSHKETGLGCLNYNQDGIDIYHPTCADYDYRVTHWMRIPELPKDA